MLNRRNVLAALAGLPVAARAQSWPARPVTIVVPFAAGGPTDFVARVLAERLAARLAQPFIVENRAGAGGDVGGQLVQNAAPDGYTFLLSTTGSLTVNRHLKPTPTYDPLRDLKPVTLTFKSDHVVIVDRKLPVATLAEFVAYAKARPDALSYGSAGLGATSHLIAELFKSKAGVKIQHVPYRGAGPALADLLAGHLHVMVDSLANALSQIQAGGVKALAVTGTARHPSLPDIPTAEEAGLPGFTAYAWGALLAPAATPDTICERLAAEVKAIYAEEATARKLAGAGADPISASPAELAAFMTKDSEQWGRVIREANITAN